MPKLPDLDEVLAKVKSTQSQISKIRAGVANAEKSANKHAKALDKLAALGRQRVDDTISNVQKKITTDSANFKHGLRSEVDEVTKLKNEAKRHYDKFSRTYTSAMNKRDGVEVKRDKIAKLANEATTHVNQISKDRTLADRNTAEIKSLLATSEEHDEEIKVIHNQAQMVSEEINNTYAITLDTSLAGTLVERRNALGKRTRLWEGAYLTSIAAIITGVIIALTVNPPNDIIDALTERLVFITPLVVVSFVLSRQFSHERKLYEEYAFKAAAAQSLRGYAVLLNDQFKDVENGRRDVLDFTLEAMRNIYDREPLQQNQTFFHFKFGNGIAKIEAKIDERIEKKVPQIVNKTLQEAVPDNIDNPPQ